MKYVQYGTQFCYRNSNRLTVSDVCPEELNALRFLPSSSTLALLLSRTHPIACIGVVQIFYFKGIFVQFENY